MWSWWEFWHFFTSKLATRWCYLKKSNHVQFSDKITGLRSAASLLKGWQQRPCETNIANNFSVNCFVSWTLFAKILCWHVKLFCQGGWKWMWSTKSISFSPFLLFLLWAACKTSKPFMIHLLKLTCFFSPNNWMKLTHTHELLRKAATLCIWGTGRNNYGKTENDWNH